VVHVLGWNTDNAGFIIYCPSVCPLNQKKISA
jgi:hypothetical protein